MSNLLELARFVERKIDEVEEAGNTASKNAVLVMVDYLVNNTPVDESTALSNWQVTLGGPAGSVIPAYVLGSHGSTREQSARQALDHAINVLQAKKPGEPAFITNNVAYLEGLNNGTKSKQPSGFFEAAIVIGRDFVASYKG